jgi:serine protease
MASFYSYVNTGFAAAVVAICAEAPRATATLFFNTTLNHYFMTSDDAEVAAIGNGAAGPGWTQLAERFLVVDRGAAAAGSGNVCRFYGTPGRGPNSHFYTIDPAECAAVKQDPGWTFEAIAFRAFYPVSAGTCPAGTVNVYRVYNNRFAFNDSNHRYTASLATYNGMIADGWRGEGTVFCAIAAP